MIEPTDKNTGFVPISNYLFDVLLPTLSDTELKVILVVLRSTLGWKASGPLSKGGYKRRDWISHRQMQQRTGRSSSAVSSAVSALVKRSLIIVEDAEGNSLDTTEQRRRSNSRLYYRPVDMWITPRIVDTRKSRTTTDSLYNIGGTHSKQKQSGAPTTDSRSGFVRIGEIIEMRE